MRKEIADRWIAALESGEYKKTKHQLYDGEGFCCLGVLCDLHRKDKLGDWIDDNSYMPNGESSDRDDTSLPGPVMDWAGMETPLGGVDDDENKTLSAMNDGINVKDLKIKAMSFLEIAQYIRENWQKL